jgi:hypothetical protein
LPHDTHFAARAVWRSRRYAQILVEAANFGQIFARCARKQILHQILENTYLRQFRCELSKNTNITNVPLLRALTVA